MTSLDINSMSLAKLAQIAEAEGLDIDIRPYNIESADIPGGLYDVIILNSGLNVLRSVMQFQM